jgi:DNA-binding transcriptional MerR regulator
MKTLTLAPERKRSAHSRGRRAPHPPKKLFYRIQEAAQLTGLKPSVLRYWETEFRELSPEKDASDQRRYRAADLEVVRAIRKLLYEDRYTIKGAREKLRAELKRLRGAGEEPNGRKPYPKVSQPSLTEFRTQRATRAAVEPAGRESVADRMAAQRSQKKMGQSLSRLRAEVNALLSMLG